MSGTSPASNGAPRIVVGYAHTASGAAALRWAVQEACRAGSVLEVVHVFDPSRRADALMAGDLEDNRREARRRAQERIGDVLEGADAAPRLVFSAVVGAVEDALADAARASNGVVLGEPGAADATMPARLARRCGVPVTLVSEGGGHRRVGAQDAARSD